MSSHNPILNNPYSEPKLYYATDNEGNLDYQEICEGRRLFKPDIAVIPTRQTEQKEVFGWNDDQSGLEAHLINLCRRK